MHFDTLRWVPKQPGFSLLRPYSCPVSINQAAKKTFEIYVGNVLHGTLAPDLVKYFHGEVVTRRLTSDSTGASILRCQVKRKHRGNTFAFVTLRSREIAEALMSGESLIFGGRRLNIGPSKAKFKRPVGVEPGFKCGGFQLCAEWPPGELTCLWAVKSGLKFQVSRSIPARLH